MTTFRLILRDLLHDRALSGVTVLGTSVLSFGFLLMTTVSLALGSIAQAEASSANLIVINPDVVDPFQGMVTETALKAIRQAAPSEVEIVSPTVFRFLRVGDRVVQLRAAPIEDWEPVHALRLISGHLPAAFGEVMIGEGLAGPGGWAPGDRIDIYGESFRIAGVAASQGIKFASVWMPLEAARELFGEEFAIQMAVVHLVPAADPDQVRARLEEVLAAQGRYAVYLEDAYLEQYREDARDISRASRVVLGAALLTLTLGSFMAAQVALEERSREVGILRALGWGRWPVSALMMARTTILTIAAYGIGAGAARLLLGSPLWSQGAVVLSIAIKPQLTPAAVAAGLLLVAASANAGVLLSSAWPGQAGRSPAR